MRTVKDILRSARRRLRQMERTATAIDYGVYRADPVRYAVEVLKVQWWEKQREIAMGLVTPPYDVRVKASHSVGKSMMAGGVINFWFDCFNPGVCLTTAPTARQVRDILWKEVRRQRGSRGGFPGPKNPRLESAPDHFAHGFTARDCTGFQGQHEEHVLVIFDEGVGVARPFWEAAETMVTGPGCAFLAIYNPTDTTSFAYLDEQDAVGSGRARLIEIPATCHPNIIAELEGKPPPYPKAIRLAWFEDKLKKWSERIDPADRIATDVEWPPGSGVVYRPGPLAQARLLARWPTVADGVWGDALWSAAESAVVYWQPDDLPEIGCDLARFGDDATEIHSRCGPVSFHHESHHGWGCDETLGRLKQLCRHYAAEWSERLKKEIDPRRLKVKVDDSGLGGQIVDHRGEYNFVGVNSATAAADPEDYPNARSELWFAMPERARRGDLTLAQLPKEVRQELKAQAMAPAWKLNSRGQRVVEDKAETKKKIGRSPDGMDALNLAYYEPASRDAAARHVAATPVPRAQAPRQAGWRERRR